MTKMHWYSYNNTAPLSNTKQQLLQHCVESISSKIEAASQMDTDSSENLPLPTSATTGSALVIIDEMADRNCRKQNIVF